jgi:hypothetical protein
MKKPHKHSIYEVLSDFDFLFVIPLVSVKVLQLLILQSFTSYQNQ